MASSTKNILLFCFLFIILRGVMGEEYSKGEKRLEREGKEVEDGEREAEGSLRDWNADYTELADRGIEGGRETKERRGTEVRSRERGPSGTFSQSETGRETEEGKGRRNDGEGREEKGGNAKETEPYENEHTTSGVGGGEPNGGLGRGGDGMTGRRKMEEKHGEENVPPQTRNPAETRDKERTRHAAAAESEEIRYEYERRGGEKMPLRSPEELKEPKVGLKTKEGKRKGRKGTRKWRERLSKEGSDPEEGGELERELREVGGEGEGVNPTENGGTEGEKENGREDPAERKVEEGGTKEEREETDRKREFEGEEGKGGNCGNARCYGKRRRGEEGVGDEKEREERYVDARKKMNASGGRLLGREETEAERYETKKTRKEENEREDMRTANGKYAFPKGGEKRDGAGRGGAEREPTLGGEAKGCGLNAAADKDAGRSGNHAAEKENVGGGEKGRSDGSVINFAGDSGRKGNCGGEEGKHTEARVANRDEEVEKKPSSLSRNKERSEYTSRSEPREKMEKGAYSSERDDGRMEGGGGEEELEEELREAGRSGGERGRKMKERASDGFGMGKGFREEEVSSDERMEHYGKEGEVVRGGNEAEPFGKIEVNPDESERERSSSKEMEVDLKLNEVKSEDKEVNPEEFREAVEGGVAEREGGKIGMDAAFAEGRPEGAERVDGDENRKDKESLRGSERDSWTRRLIPPGKKTEEVVGCGSECDEHPVRGQSLSPNSGVTRLPSGETSGVVKDRVEKGTVSDVIDDELEIDFPSSMEANPLNRLKGEVEGDLEDVNEGMAGAAEDGESPLGGDNLKTGQESLTGYFDGRRTSKSYGMAKNYSEKSSPLDKKESETKTYNAIGKDTGEEIFVKQIESLKTYKVSRQEALESKAESAFPPSPDKQEIEKAEVSHEHTRSTIGKFLRAGTGETEEYDITSYPENGAPVVVSEGGATDAGEEFIGRALNDGEGYRKNHLPSLRATDNSMRSRRIPAVKSDKDTAPKSNPARNLEAGVVGTTVMGREIPGDGAGKRSGPKNRGRWKGEEREKVGRASFLRKDGNLKDALDEHFGTEEEAKGPRRILMSVSEEGEGMANGKEQGNPVGSKGEEIPNDISVIEKNLGKKNRVPSSQRGPLDETKGHANGVEFVPRKKDEESEGEGKMGVYSSPRIPSDTHVGGKSIVNSASAASRGGKERNRSGAKNGGIALGDKFYHREKGGFLAVSMGGIAKGKLAPGKHQPANAGEEKQRKIADKKTKEARGESGDETESNGTLVTAKSATKQHILKGQGSVGSEIRFFKAQRRSGRAEVAHARRSAYRAGKKTTATSVRVGYLKPYDVTRTTVSAGDYGALEAPPTLSTEAKSLGTVDGTASGKEAEIEYELPNPLTTAPTPNGEENRKTVSVLVKNPSVPFQVDQGDDYVTYQLSPPVQNTFDCRREKNEAIENNALDNNNRYGVSDGKVGCSGKENMLSDEEEEHLGYTRLQVRKPRMLDASGFGRGRGSGSVGVLPSHSSGGGKKGTLTVGIILPYIAFGQREYTRAINTAITGLQKSKVRKLEFFKKYIFLPQQVRSVMMQLTPSPTAILNSLCKEFLSVNVSAILYLMNYEKYGRSTASAQYFLQLAGYLGIPVIAWNADNSGLERRASQSSLQLQLAPSLEHQTAAMLSILERYKWHQFSIVTSQIAGHDDFVQAVRERILDMQDVFKFTILNAVLVTKPSDLSELVNSESRVVLLYCTREEALSILAAAADYKITGENYVWVAAQSVIENTQPMPQFPVGMLGVHFDTSMSSLVTEIATAVKVYAYGVEDFVNDPRNEKLSLNTQLSCEGVGDSRWKVGDRFFKYLRNVSVEGEHGKPNIEFTADGVLKAAELKIMNLRPGVSKQLVWEEIGVWKSWEREGLDIKDIVWPGGSHTPPQGVPEKFHMRITFLEEPPYINVAPPDPITGKCSINRGVLCRFAAETDMSGLDVLQAHRNASYYQCCSGFCIDLLEKFSEELGFTYELVRVEDGKWGTLENGKWNGLIADLINRKTDMVMTSLMINSDREAVVDFTVPFMESGIAIVVAKRTGIISPTAFLEPFDTASWMLVGAVAIQVSTFTIFLFEWLSPSGFNMKVAPSTNHRFSLFRTYWLVWAVLFQAAVHVDCPKGFTARFMTNVWAMFAVVFLAIYTANLAAFMITREEFHEFSGIDDHRLAKPFSHKPMYKFGTIPWGHTDSTLKKYFREMHAYMKRHNRSVVGEGIEAVLSGELDAFIYDGTVLDYLVSQDEDCRLLTVGSWYAMTGYGLAFQRNSKYVRMFNQRLLDFRENGDLERLRRYWMTGSCKPGKQERKSSDPLALEQFLSAFLLLMCGILFAAFLLFLEHLYFKYVRHHLARTDRGGCCALVSLSMGKSLTFRGAVYEAQDMYRTNRPRGLHQHQHSGGHRAFTGGGRNCNCSYCEGLHNLWATRRELEACRLRIRHLEKQMEAHGIRPLPPPPPQTLPLLLPLPGSSPGNRRYLNDEDALRTRDMTRNHVTSTEYCGQLYRPCRTEIAEMETVL